MTLAFDQPLRREAGRPAAGFPPPFFIVGCARSGTTLVRRILDCHSRLAVYHESQFYPLIRQNLDRYGDLRLPGPRGRLISDLLEAVRVQGEDAPTSTELEESLVEPTFEGIFATWLQLYARSRGKARGGDKTPQHHAYLDEILERFPVSPVVFLVRDPRDTVLSLRRAFGWSLAGAAREWNRAFHSLRTVSRPVHLVRYEELVRHPAEVVEGICLSLGESYEPSILRFHERQPARVLAPRALAKHARPIDARSVGRSRELSPNQIRWIEDACAEGMEALEYPFQAPRSTSTAPKPAEGKVLRVLLDRLRFYGFHRQRWRWGWFWWRVFLRVRVRHALASALKRVRLRGT